MGSANETIAAIATASGRGGVGVIRISGSQAEQILLAFCTKLPAPRVATLANFTDQNNNLIDQGLILYFPAPHSFTGESVVEIQAHGGVVLLDQLLARVIELGARLAEPGEFSQRAFLNDKLDLAQAEAIADLIDASSRKAVRAAARSLSGVFSEKVNEVLAELIELRVYVESAIDFPEEEIDFLSDGQVGVRTQHLLENIKELIENATQGSILREGINVVITGKPNAGKSSLLNCLAQQQRAIVSDVAGTTRDVLIETISLDGMPVNIIDTAGIRTDSTDPVEQEGIRRARAQIAQADCLINIFDITDKIIEADEVDGIKTINVFNKIDLVNQQARVEQIQQKSYVYISVKTGEGIDLLKRQLKQLVGYESDSEGVFIARRRHLDALNQAHHCVRDGLSAINNSAAGELLAEDLLHAQQALNEITGEFTSDDLLGEIFSSFCIGK